MGGCVVVSVVAAPVTVVAASVDVGGLAVVVAASVTVVAASVDVGGFVVATVASGESGVGALQRSVSQQVTQTDPATPVHCALKLSCSLRHA